MRTDEFDFFLPEDRIAAYPASRRDESRLMVVGRADGNPIHSKFANIGQHLPARSVIVLNDTRVIPARLRGNKATGGAIELLLTRRTDDGTAASCVTDWDALGRNLGWAAIGSSLSFEGGLEAEILQRGEAGVLQVRLRSTNSRPVMELLDSVGEIPLPPYIENARKQSQQSQADPHAIAGVPTPTALADARAFDRERYQTVFAAQPGAVAAPTAGLHFTEQLLTSLQAAGHQIVRLTLHVGPGTFRPVKTEAIDDHQMDPEWYVIGAEAAATVNQAREEGRPVVAVGTTVVRALESAARQNPEAPGAVCAGASSSRLFLKPGSTFHVVTDLVTNFHLPRSTLLMLVAAFVGRARMLEAYEIAVQAGYRFYSYGDAMLLRGSP